MKSTRYRETPNAQWNLMCIQYALEYRAIHDLAARNANETDANNHTIEAFANFIQS